ncbi:Trm112 family protein [Ignisphaera sp. 4213-co]|uniref:Trm112 family protein n=1 Tax=Ignisphaera cupida TaxID=3050454 RepID=A0ABD4Z8P4_9CREN|nr:Trm112 family protein [Ignisphaera sp. 4213-co]MDK6029297.1 Trm112 family protein [Ignisphaera sp. 4213-co]
MKYRLLNYLACPYCKDKGFPLKLVVIEIAKYESRKIPQNVQIPLCDLYCSYKNGFVKELTEKGIEIPCNECIKIEVKTGVLYCNNCSRWYPIIDEIPRLLPDSYRKKSEDLEFLSMYKDKVPEEIKMNGKPYNLLSK